MTNYADNERRLADDPTPEMVRKHAQDHVAYEWSRRPWGHWSEENKRIYNEAFDEALRAKKS